MTKHYLLDWHPVSIQARVEWLGKEFVRLEKWLIKHPNSHRRVRMLAKRNAIPNEIEELKAIMW